MSCNLYKLPKNFRLFIFTVLAIEFLLFNTHYTVNYLPYYPHAYDQTTGLISSYATYYSINDNGVLWALKNISKIQHELFKGPMVPLLGSLFLALFGPSRLSIIWVNFFFFALGQVFLFLYFIHRNDFRAGLIAWGLFLLSGSHYIFPGGITDIRFDYAGMVTFGLATILLINLIENSGAMNLILTIIAIGISGATRSLTGIYLSVLVVILAALFTLNLRFNYLPQFARRQFNTMGILLAILFVILVAAFIVLRRGALGYYGLMFKTGEQAIRAAESGADTLLNFLFYYPNSSVTHFAYLYFIGGLVLLSYVLSWVFHFNKEKSALQSHRRVLSFYLLYFAVVVVSVFIPLLMYSQNPIVIGVLTMPITWMLTILVTTRISLIPRHVGIGIAFLIMTFGGAVFIENMVHLNSFSSSQLVDEETVNDSYRDLYEMIKNRDTDATVYWMINHEAFIPQSFEVYLYEHGGRWKIPSIHAIPATIFTISGQDIIHNIDQADFVIASNQFPPIYEFEYPYTLSLRETEKSWRKELNDSFVEIHEYSLLNGPWKIGLYARSCQIISFRTLYNVEHTASGPFFWLGNESMEVIVNNYSGDDLNGVFEANGAAGPSNSNMESRSVEYVINNATGNLTLGKNTGWQLSIPLTLKPGENVLSLSDKDSADPKLNPNNDPRQLLLMVSKMHVSCYSKLINP